MKLINKSVLILIVSLVINDVRCQDGYSDQSNIHMKQISSNEGNVETITSYSTNVIQSDPKSQAISSVNAHYHIADDPPNTFSDYERADRGRTRKIYRIKNPFHQQDEEEDINKQNLNVGSKDSDTGSTNQYAGMQYSLPPEEFLQQMRAENQYNHQQQLQQQQQQLISTPAPAFGYTATPQPTQYQYSTISSSSYNNGNQQNNLTPQSEPKYSPQLYNGNLNNYQYHNAHSFGIEAIQSTPSSVTLYLSTSSPNNQYIGTPSNNYVSSLSPLFLSSPASSPSYISTTLSNNPTGSPNYNNIHRHSSNVERDLFNYGTNNRDSNENIYVGQYDNSANGVKFTNMQQQFQNEIPSSTQIPISSMYPDISRENWQNSRQLSLNNVPNSRSEYTQASQQNLQSNYQETQQSSNVDNPSNDLHQMGSMQSANNLVLSFVQPDYHTFNELKNRERETELQSKRDEVYSHGDYGWKLDGRKPLVNYDVNLPINYPNQQNNNYQPDTSLNFSYRQMDNGKNNDNDVKSKYKTEKSDAQEFAKSAAKAQENMKNQQETYLNNYSFHARYPQNMFSNTEPGNYMISNNNNNQKSFTNDNINTYVKGQSDLVTPSSYYYQNSRENMFDNKVKQPFDQEKVLQNIVKVDVSNSISNIEPQVSMTDANNRYISSNNSKDINDNLNQFVKPFSETHYKDKNMFYAPNTGTGDVFSSDSSRRLEPSYENAKKYESPSNSVVYKPHTDLGLPSFHYLGQSNSGNTQPQNNIQQQSMQRSQSQGSSDSNYSLKLNDIPYWLQGMNNMHFSQLQNDVNQGIISTGTPLLLNQNIESHQIDVAASILNKLIREKQMEMNSKLEYNPQRETLIPSINGIKVMNPYNLDLKMVTEILKDKINDINSSFRNQFNQPTPLRWDMSQLKQLLLKTDNAGQYSIINNGLGSPGSPFFEVDTSNRFPYQGVKYSRSQEEAETLIPLTDSTHNHPIGAVIEQDDLENENREAIDSGLDGSKNDDFPVETEDDKSKISPNYRIIGSRYRNPNSLLPERHSFQRKNPKIIIGEPYPLLKPPPIRILNGRSRNKFDNNRRQHRNKYKLSRIVKREPLFEEESFNDNVNENVPTLLRPPPVAEDKSDKAETTNS